MEKGKLDNKINIEENSFPTTKVVGVHCQVSKRTMRDAIDEHWKGEPVKYFNSSDLLNMINGETYLKYEYKKANQVVIYFGNNDIETAIKVCWTAKQIDDLVKSIIF